MKTRHGTTCHPHGRQIDVISDYPEWTAWAVAALKAAANTEIEQAERDAYATDREEQMRGSVR